MANFVSNKTIMNTIAALALELSLERALPLKKGSESAELSSVPLATKTGTDEVEELLDLLQQVSPELYIGPDSNPVETVEGSSKPTESSVGAAKGSDGTTEGSVGVTEGSVGPTEPSVETTEGLVEATESSSGSTEGLVETAEGSARTTEGLVGTTEGLVITAKLVQGTLLRSTEWATRANVLDSPYLKISKSIDVFQDLGLTAVKWSSIAHTAYVVTIVGHFICLVTFHLFNTTI